MTYEELFKIAGSRLEAVDEALQMLDPEDMGMKEYNATFRAYNRFAETGSMKDFEAVVDKLYTVMGYRI